MSVQLVTQQAKVARKGRYPIHNHLVEHRPLQIMPFMIAPVMAGETLKNLALQGRVVSDPVVAGAGNINPWWCEHHYFYVKARQLVKEEFETMVLEGSALGVTDAAAAHHGHPGAGIDWVGRALHFVVEEGGFRDEGEAWNVADSTLDNLPMAMAIKHANNWADSLKPDGAVDPANNLVNPHLEGVVLAEYLEQYERMRDMRLIDMDFEDYLEMHGVNVRATQAFEKPERIRTMSNWTYPTNTIADDGTATGAVLFSIAERADKDRFFSEPGFIIGLTVLRPKLFMGNQKAPAVIAMDTPGVWMPPMLRDQPHTTVKEFVGGNTVPTGPLRNQTNGYWFDVRDLFKYGDDFLVYAGANGFAPALPNAAGSRRWATSAMINAWFKDEAKNKIRQNGLTRLSILGHPTTSTDNT